jgi:hypothetical protein
VRDETAASSPALTVLAFLLAAAILIEWAPALGPLHEPDLSPNRPLWHGSLLLCGAAIALLLRPSSTPRLLFLSACGAYNALSLMPGINNHNFFTLIADLSIGAAALFTWATTPGSGGPRRTFYRTVAPVLRAELLVLYFWAFFHKLNRDFFDPEVSCATVQLFQLSGSLPFVPTDDWVRSLAMLGTLAVELTIPLLLMIPRARWLGVLLGIGFHSILAFNYPGFSALAFAFYSLFLPESSYDQLALEQERGSLSDLIPATGAARLFVEVCLFAAIAAGLAVFYAQRLVLGLPKAGLAVAWGIALAIIVARRFAPRADARAGERRALAMPALAFWLLPSVVFLSGLAPHLGVKNVHAFAMFSNLRTGSGDTNHLLLPRGLQLSNNLADVVRIRGSNDPVLDSLKSPSRENAFVLLPSPDPWLENAGRTEFHFELPYLTLRTRVTELASLGVQGLEVSFERGGETKRVTNAENDPELANVSWPVRKLMRLRAVPVSDRAPCMW